jgi:hypothetical protein
MTVRTPRIAGGIVMIPVADDTCGKDQKRDQRQANPEDANRLPHSHAGESDWTEKLIEY